MSAIKPWYQDLDLEKFDYSNSVFELNWVYRKLIMECLAGRGAPVGAFWGQANPIKGDTRERLDELLKMEDGVLVYRDRWTGSFKIAYPNGFMEVTSEGLIEDRGLRSAEREGASITAHCVSTDPELHKRLDRFFTENTVLVRKNLVNVLTSTPSGVDLKQVTAQDSTLIPENYSEEVVKQYQHILSDLQSSSPCGRLSIADGPPGTGKTHLVRSLISTATDRVDYLIIPPSSIQAMEGPGLLPLLIDRHADSKKTLCIILEDADEILVPRAEGSMNGIAALLNLSDGIVGSLVDVRIIATTNASYIYGEKKMNMDPAIYRPGRLCRRVAVGPLSTEQANSRYHQLGGEEESPFKGPTTLAEVYAAAKQDAPLAPLSAAPRSIGFQPDFSPSIPRSQCYSPNSTPMFAPTGTRTGIEKLGLKKLIEQIEAGRIK